MDDWRGYLIAFFALVWIANVYMSLFARVRIELKKERTEVSVLEKKEKQQGQAVVSDENDMNKTLPKSRADRSKNWTSDSDRSAARRLSN
jgi:hypothetical protein